MSIDWRVEVVGTAQSTQDIAHNNAIGGADEGYVIQAMQQTGARGRHGNQWDAPMGNLYISFVLTPDCTPNEAGPLSFVIAAGLSKALESYIDTVKHKKTLKWPNDILLDGLKLSGILLESNLGADGSLDSLVVGIGVNIFKAPEFAISLQEISTKPVYINVFRDEMLACIADAYQIWQEKGFAPIRTAWLKEAHGLNEPMSARLPTVTHKGTFGGVNEAGALLLNQENGQSMVIQAGDVHFGTDEA